MGAQHFSNYRGSVDGGFDIDGDQVPDYIVGASLEDVGSAANVGVVRLYSGAGAASLTFPISPSRSGATATVQAFVTDPGVPQGFSATQGLELMID